MEYKYSICGNQNIKTGVAFQRFRFRDKLEKDRRLEKDLRAMK